MALPAPAPDFDYPIMRELKTRLETLSNHLQNALEDHALPLQTAFLKDFAQNVGALHKLLSSMSPEFKSSLEELSISLTNILNLPIEMQGGKSMSVLQAIKNYTSPSPAESDLSLFFISLEKYPESCRILAQELDLLAKDL
jgi:hypothetical protein